MGELHIVFTALKGLGKLIDGSGLDQVFEEAGVYGSATVNQIKDGKHLHRAFEAHQMLYLSLYRIYIGTLVEKNPAIKKEMREGIVEGILLTENHRQKTEGDLTQNHNNLLGLLKSLDFSSIQRRFDEQLRNQAKFFRNYMALFELLLLFVRATRQQSWEIHLSSLHNLCKYFFGYDQINYARLTPVYLAQMFSLGETDPITWSMFEDGNF